RTSQYDAGQQAGQLHVGPVFRAAGDLVDPVMPDGARPDHLVRFAVAFRGMRFCIAIDCGHERFSPAEGAKPQSYWTRFALRIPRSSTLYLPSSVAYLEAADTCFFPPTERRAFAASRTARTILS